MYSVIEASGEGDRMKYVDAGMFPAACIHTSHVRVQALSLLSNRSSCRKSLIFLIGVILRQNTDVCLNEILHCYLRENITSAIKDEHLTSTI